MDRPAVRRLIRDHLHTDRQDPFRRWLRYAYRRYRLLVNTYRFKGKTPRDVFTIVYEDGLWGRDDRPDAFYSGSGSHDADITGPYVTALTDFLDTLDRPDIVDMGCGDFAVGEQIRGRCRSYIAADIVENLIARNREKYRHLDVDFRIIDIANMLPPRSDVLIVRQVFQHMSNIDILSSLSNIKDRYRYIVVTEHLPSETGFLHNLEKSPGPDIRLYAATPSGVVLTSAPFGLRPRHSRVLCEIAVDDGVCRSVIRTNLYEM